MQYSCKNIYVLFIPYRNISSVEKNAATNATHTVRYADKFNDVAYLTACGAWSGNRFSTELSSLTGCLTRNFLNVFLKNLSLSFYTTPRRDSSDLPPFGGFFRNLFR